MIFFPILQIFTILLVYNSWEILTFLVFRFSNLQIFMCKLVPYCASSGNNNGKLELAKFLQFGESCIISGFEATARYTRRPQMHVIKHNS